MLLYRVQLLGCSCSAQLTSCAGALLLAFVMLRFVLAMAARSPLRPRQSHTVRALFALQSSGEEDDMPEFMRQFLLQKFGLPSLSEGYMYAICKTVRTLQGRSRRLGVFGRMVGVIDPDRCGVFGSRLRGVTGCWVEIRAEHNCRLRFRVVVARSTVIIPCASSFVTLSPVTYCWFHLLSVV